MNKWGKILNQCIAMSNEDSLSAKFFSQHLYEKHNRIITKITEPGLDK